MPNSLFYCYGTYDGLTEIWKAFEIYCIFTFIACIGFTQVLQQLYAYVFVRSVGRDEPYDKHARAHTLNTLYALIILCGPLIDAHRQLINFKNLPMNYNGIVSVAKNINK